MTYDEFITSFNLAEKNKQVFRYWLINNNHYVLVDLKCNLEYFVWWRDYILSVEIISDNDEIELDWFPSKRIKKIINKIGK